MVVAGEHPEAPAAGELPAHDLDETPAAVVAKASGSLTTTSVDHAGTVHEIEAAPRPPARAAWRRPDQASHRRAARPGSPRSAFEGDSSAAVISEIGSAFGSRRRRTTRQRRGHRRLAQGGQLQLRLSAAVVSPRWRLSSSRNAWIAISARAIPRARRRSGDSAQPVSQIARGAPSRYRLRGGGGWTCR